MNAPSTDTVLLVLSVLGAAWKLWKAHKAHQSIKAALLSVVRQEVLELAGNSAAAANARGWFEDAVKAQLERMGMKRDSDLDLLVHEVVEQGVLELKNLIAAKQLPGQVDQVAAAAAGVAASFTPPANPTVPPLAIAPEELREP